MLALPAPLPFLAERPQILLHEFVPFLGNHLPGQLQAAFEGLGDQGQCVQMQGSARAGTPRPPATPS